MKSALGGFDALALFFIMFVRKMPITPQEN